MYWPLDIGIGFHPVRRKDLEGLPVGKGCPCRKLQSASELASKVLLLSDSVLWHGTYPYLLSHSTKQRRYLGHLRHFDLVKYSPVKSKC